MEEVVDVVAPVESGANEQMPDLWDKLAQAESAVSLVENVERAVGAAVSEERQRCYSIVLDEIERGRVAGLPATSAAVKLLYRVASAINNG